ncbi:unnamed protein product [Cylicocyclus nassatus]|uniref:Uncharacterized protein n=1 Tax=Cylicocyclus nassatus TaxID=53992 RepID=A0AA36GJH8_CYLNA|nr:unnamed protein product [Cylicocyclus nassatus]
MFEYSNQHNFYKTSPSPPLAGSEPPLHPPEPLVWGKLLPRATALKERGGRCDIFAGIIREREQENSAEEEEIPSLCWLSSTAVLTVKNTIAKKGHISILIDFHRRS